MPPLRTLLHPAYPWRFLKSRLHRLYLQRNPSERGRFFFPPGHFYSPLLDLERLKPAGEAFENDGAEDWRHVPLHEDEQRLLFDDLLSRFPVLPFPQQATPAFRYHSDNDWFPLPDAVTLSALVRREKPRRILEVGSGFSTAVVLDTLERCGGDTEIICVEPHPERLKLLLRPGDEKRLTLLPRPVQDTPLDRFRELESGDFLFIDSSHVAKIGSDVSFIFLRILPLLKPGVWVHFHDIFYPQSYPIAWLREGRAWNESLFLRTFLIGHEGLKVRAFNNYASFAFPSPLWDRLPAFRERTGSSIWLQSC